MLDAFLFILNGLRGNQFKEGLKATYKDPHHSNAFQHKVCEKMYYYLPDCRKHFKHCRGGSKLILDLHV